MLASAKMKERPVHHLGSFRALQPPLRPVHLGIVSEDFLVLVNDPGVTANDSTTGDVFTEDCAALRRHYPLEVECKGRVDAESFLYAGPKVGEIAHLVESGFALRRFEALGWDVRIDLCLEFGVAPWGS